MINEYHIPVLFETCLKAMELDNGTVFVDVTFGGGGHSKAILERIGEDAVLIAFDQDEDALANVVEDDKLIFVNANFRYLKNFLKYYEHPKVDAVLADLGVSSHQFDAGERGFSIRTNAKLDMRMNQQADVSAYHVVNDYPERDLFAMFNAYADLKNVRKVVYAIVNKRNEGPIETTGQLVELLSPLMIGKKLNQFLAQIFQAIRIEVNDEMGALRDMLEQAADVLKPGGRLVVMSYHSIEDRLVKNFIRSGKFTGEAEKDLYGNIIKPLSAVNKKPIVPTEEENKVNSRARSAKLRVATKNAE
ncbi:16S rRNA (cytosine(1402)-N(4))-methyltransferase [Putridiphycobacter roseus]|uniref:Ribosomal RNA small subunit methyltransferase H n=2 Tax=Putridiphycobacter roseus TaxID=2219161 RepID=A0A2W1NHK0_9FLAO|nr:16S rRNA (cytosine(1402)-N(4))-methyltransferase RsmH [Putridiphycobacter roseus]PZE18573.1 16S rRNA (cytosine(1402)-N(4))-methyltransferase [Putridiphycobacter roseus]